MAKRSSTFQLQLSLSGEKTPCCQKVSCIAHKTRKDFHIVFEDPRLAHEIDTHECEISLHIVERKKTFTICPFGMVKLLQWVVYS